MKHQKKLNKAITDSLAGLFSEGIDVNVKIEKEALVNIGLLVLVSSIIVGGVSYGFHLLRKL